MSKKILIADDNQDALNILSATLKKGGYSVEVARDGQETLEMMASEEPVLVLLDIMMPKMDGFGVLQLVKADPQLSPIPVIIITAKTDAASRKRGLHLGANDYLMKPIKPAELLRKVREILSDTDLPPSSPTLPFLSFVFWRRLFNGALFTRA